MFKPMKVVEVELSRSLEDVAGLAGYQSILGLVRLHGTPLGYVRVPVHDGRCPATAIGTAILEQHSWPIIQHLMHDCLTESRLNHLTVSKLVKNPHPVYDGPTPLVTVAVCTRDRTSNLAVCLDALMQLDYPALDLLLVDNAPTSDATELLVRTHYPRVRYVREQRPGLDRARNRAIIEAKADFIAYTDDDVIVDAGWVSAIARLFAKHPEVMAITGLVVPHEIETEAQYLFELYGGFGRGFSRKWYRGNLQNPTDTAKTHGGAGKFGTGANMAFRRQIFSEIGGFDPALDVGTVTNGGGDLEMFFRVLREGYTLVYQPSAIVYHRHRKEYGQLRTQVTNNGIGFYAFLMRNIIRYPETRRAFIKLGLWWLWWWNVRRLLGSIIRPTRFPRDLIVAELRGSLVGLTRYQKAQRAAAEGAVSHPLTTPSIMAERALPGDGLRHRTGTAVRSIDLNQRVQDLEDVQDYAHVLVFLLWKEHPLGSIEIANQYEPIRAMQLIDRIIDQLSAELIETIANQKKAIVWQEIAVELSKWIKKTTDSMNLIPSTQGNASVSVVIATYDRPDDLRACLHRLLEQETTRSVEIVVVDNNPRSGLTPPIANEFPNVIFVSEQRQGLSYARNAGIAASGGDIVITTDDDVTMPAHWLEKIVAPFSRPDVMAVTGNTFPQELETKAQQLFEMYGGLGRGFKSLEANGTWFESFRYKAAPTWKLGATANAAFRATIFNDPKIGLMEETLGAGMPTGCSEDTYIFYRLLKAGYTLVYEPTAFVWHTHRRDLKGLRRQLYNYSKGHVAYHLLILCRDHDLRAFLHLVFWLPYGHLWRIGERLRQRTSYPLHFNLIEMMGNIVGPWALWRASRRVKKFGRSRPYVPVPLRSHSKEPSAQNNHKQVTDKSKKEVAQ